MTDPENNERTSDDTGGTRATVAAARLLEAAQHALLHGAELFAFEVRDGLAGGARQVAGMVLVAGMWFIAWAALCGAGVLLLLPIMSPAGALGVLALANAAAASALMARLGRAENHAPPPTAAPLAAPRNVVVTAELSGGRP